MSRAVLRSLGPVLLLVGLSASAVAGQALPFHTTTGITAGFQENAARAFGSFLGRRGLVRDGAEVADPMEREVEAAVVVLGAIPWAITPLWTTRVVIPWVDKSLAFTGNDEDRLEFETSGLGDALVDTKWVFLSRNRLRASTRVGIQAGVKVPLGDTDARLPDGTVAPPGLQRGTGSWDFPVELVVTDIEGPWGFHGNVGWRFNTEADGFESGDVFNYDAAVGFRLSPRAYESLDDHTVVAYLELNGAVQRQARADGRKVEDSGGHVLLLSPDLQWVPRPWLLFEGSVQIPVLQDLNGSQLEHDTRFQIGTRVRFSVLR